MVNSLDNNLIIKGYRYVATGVFGYDYYIDDEMIGYASGIVAPDNCIIIRGSNISLESKYDMQNTLVPGVTRYVNDTVTGKIVAELKYNGSGCYIINESLFVECRDGYYSFLCNDEEFAYIKNSYDLLVFDKYEKEYDRNFHLDIVAIREINEELLMLILSFSMLRFDADGIF